MRAENLLMVADSERDADMLYAVGMFIADPFVYFTSKGRSHVVISDLEVDRGRRQAPHCRVIPLSSCTRKLKPREAEAGGFAQVIRLVAKQHGISRFSVPPQFPYGLARELRRVRIRLKVRRAPFFMPAREFKCADEVKKISAALMMAEVGMAEAMQALRNAKVGAQGKLVYRNAPLTSERLRSIIEVAILQAGGTASHTIVAGGSQACDPHETGSGPLRANQPIIIDIFPRSRKTGYYGDITRTVVKGRASEGVRRLYDVVRRGQETAFGLIRDNVDGRQIHGAVQALFAQEGYRTGRQNGHLQGFFHGTGHGLGLDLHEPPRISASSAQMIRAGHVVTVEPGLYYPRLGGVRLEDVVFVEKTRARNLTKFEKVLEV